MTNCAQFDQTVKCLDRSSGNSTQITLFGFFMEHDSYVKVKVSMCQSIIMSVFCSDVILVWYFC